MNDKILFNIKDLNKKGEYSIVKQYWAGEIDEDGSLTALKLQAGRPIEAVQISILGIPNIDQMNTSSWHKFYKFTGVKPSEYKKQGLDGEHYNIIRELYYFIYKIGLRDTEVEYNWNILQQWKFAKQDQDPKVGHRRLEIFSF